jgi:hypothetical protein
MIASLRWATFASEACECRSRLHDYLFVRSFDSIFFLSHHYQIVVRVLTTNLNFNQSNCRSNRRSRLTFLLRDVSSISLKVSSTRRIISSRRKQNAYASKMRRRHLKFSTFYSFISFLLKLFNHHSITLIWLTFPHLNKLNSFEIIQK